MNNQDVLKYALEHGMIDMPYVQEQIQMEKRKELLRKHPYEIWEGKDGKWHTYLPDENKGRSGGFPVGYGENEEGKKYLLYATRKGVGAFRTVKKY